MKACFLFVAELEIVNLKPPDLLAAGFSALLNRCPKDIGRRVSGCNWRCKTPSTRPVGEEKMESKVKDLDGLGLLHDRFMTPLSTSNQGVLG